MTMRTVSPELFKVPIDDIDAIVFGIAAEIGINCELFNISPHPFQPCRKYKWFFTNSDTYFQTEIKDEELWVGYSGEFNKGFPLNDPNLSTYLIDWIKHLQGQEGLKIEIDTNSDVKDWWIK